LLPEDGWTGRAPSRGLRQRCWRGSTRHRDLSAVPVGQDVDTVRIDKEDTMSTTADDAVRAAVRETYRQIAESDRDGCCSPSVSSCCDTSPPAQVDSRSFGYSDDDLAVVPDGADLGLGCGNPGAIAAMKPGETVLDLGSGAGFDAFLAARAVGSSGRVIGVDMTPAMVSKARANAEKSGYDNVEFRLGEIEHLPVADGTIDVIISNCVINLSPDKAAVFADAYRVLRPGGRLAISDVVASAELPDEIRNDLRLYSGCVAGASLISELRTMLLDAGFENVVIAPKDESKTFIEQWAPGRSVTDYVVSATIEAVRPPSRSARS
jgi:arsenite methyltransferase